MKRAIVQSFCDMRERHGRQLVAAPHEDTPIAWDGSAGALDLCDACYDETSKVLDALMTLAHEQSRKLDRRDQSYYDGLKEWAEKEGIDISGDAGRKAKYPPALKKRYDEYLKTIQPVAD